MRNLYLKHHGLPGIGVTAPDGLKGETGKNVRFGFINDFFDTEELTIGTFVKIARRTKDSDIYTHTLSGKVINQYTQETRKDGTEGFSSIITEFGQYLSQLYILAVNQNGYSINLTTGLFEKYILEKFNSKSDAVYYTGRYFDKHYYDKYVSDTKRSGEEFATPQHYIDIDEEYILTGGLFQLQENGSQVGKGIRYIKTNASGLEALPYIQTADTKMLNIELDSYPYGGKISNQSEYLSNYTYNEGTTIPAINVRVSLSPKEEYYTEDETSSVEYEPSSDAYAVTYDYDDVAYMSSKKDGNHSFLAYTNYIADANTMTYDEAVDFTDNPLLTDFALSPTYSSTYISSFYVLEYRDKEKETPDTYDPYLRDYPDDITIDTAAMILSSRLMGVTNYATVDGDGVSVRKTIKSNETDKYKGRKFVNFDDRIQFILYNLKRSMKLELSASSFDDFFVDKVLNPKYDEYITDKDNNVFIGLDYYGDSTLSKMVNDNTKSLDYDAIMDYIRNMKLFQTYNENGIGNGDGYNVQEFEEIVEDYVSKINISLEVGKTMNSNVRWYEEPKKTISIPTTLRADIKAGDTIYFYTDENSMCIEYMVTITEDMIGCNIEQLMQYASKQVSQPFNYKNLFSDDVNNRVISFENTNIVYKDDIDNQLDNYDVRSQMNILCNVDKSNMYVASYSNNAESHILQLIPNDSVKNETSLCIKTDEEPLYEDNEFHYTMSSSEPVKMSSLYINNTKSVNSEMLDIVNDMYVRLENGNLTSLQVGNFIETEHLGTSDTLDYVLYKSDYIKEGVDFDAYSYGYIVYNGDYYKECESMATKFTMSLTPYDLLDKKEEDEVLFNILMFVRNNNGMTYYSKLHKLTVGVDSKGDISGDISLNVVGDDNAIVTLDADSNISIEVAGLSCNELEGQIDDGVVIKAVNDDISKSIRITGVLVNKNDISGAICSYTNEWFGISETSRVEGIEYHYAITRLTDNIPDLKGVTTKDTDDYMMSGDDTASEEQQLFQRLYKGEKSLMSSDRKILVTVNYVDDISGQSGVAYKYITQPGFSDPRTIPSVSIDVKDDIISMEQCNNVENGILSNQVQMFADINIGDFGYDNWGKYIKNMDDVKLDLTISNIDYYVDFINKYSANMSEYTVRSTVKIIDDYAEKNDTSVLNLLDGEENNYVRIHAGIMKQGIGNVNNMSYKKLDGNEVSSVVIDSDDVPDNDMYIVHKTSYNDGSQHSIDTGYKVMEVEKSPCIILDNNIQSSLINPYNPTTSNIYKGINDFMDIHLNNITIEQASEPFKLRLLFEFGNPVLANIYMRFAVTQIRVRYNNGEGEKTFTVSYSKAKSTYLCDITENSIDFKYMSKPVDMMINPISLTACPESEESNIRYISGSVKKVGDEDNIKVKTEFYKSDVYDSSLMTINALDQRDGQQMNWSALKIKSKYLQDNIQNIQVSPLSLTDFIDNGVIDCSTNSFLADENVKKEEGTLSVYDNQTLKSIANNNYLSVVYRSSIMNPKLRNDVYTFYYNDKEYMKSKYDQFDNNLPMFISETTNIGVRTDMFMQSIDTWNFEYQQTVRKLMDDTFTGVINTYGNGYMYLSSSADNGQYTEKESMSLEDTKTAGENYIYGMLQVDTINTPYKITDSTPDKKKYFRSFLYNIGWEYPVYNGDGKIFPYQIVSPFDYLTRDFKEKKNVRNDEQTLDGDEVYIDWAYMMRQVINDKNERMIPYNLLYSCYPRCMYNDDYDTLNITMLRKPTIGHDGELLTTNKYNFDSLGNILDYNKVYNYMYLTNRLFKLADGEYIQDLDYENGYDV